MRWVVLVLLALSFISAPVVAQVPDDQLIVPGVRIGKWTLEMTIDQLLQMRGEPGYIGRAGGSDLLLTDAKVYIWDQDGWKR